MYSPTLMEHFSNPRNVGELEAPDYVGQAGEPGSGPFMVLHLAVDGERVTAARFQTYGCGPAIAAGSFLTEHIIGRSRMYCASLGTEDIVDGLGGMPEDKLHCAQLAIDALREALAKWASDRPAAAGASDPSASG